MKKLSLRDENRRNLASDFDLRSWTNRNLSKSSSEEMNEEETPNKGGEWTIKLPQLKQPNFRETLKINSEHATSADKDIKSENSS